MTCCELRVAQLSMSVCWKILGKSFHPILGELESYVLHGRGFMAHVDICLQCKLATFAAASWDYIKDMSGCIGCVYRLQPWFA